MWTSSTARSCSAHQLSKLATWKQLEPEQQRALIHHVERAYKNKLGTLREARDRRLGAILRALEQARTT